MVAVGRGDRIPSAHSPLDDRDTDNVVVARLAGECGAIADVSDKVVRHWSVEELLADAGAPTDDDVSITADGRRLDSPDKVIAFLEEINEQRRLASRES